MKEGRIRTEIDLKYFKERVNIEGSFMNSASEYFYMISNKDINYILRGFYIQSETEKINQTLLTNIYQEYFLMKSLCYYNAHIAKPLALDYKILSSEMCIEILYEDCGVSLDKLKPLNIKTAYTVMLESINRLVLLHNIGVTSKLTMMDNSDILGFIGIDISLNDRSEKEAKILRNKMSKEAYDWAKSFCSVITSKRE